MCQADTGSRARRLLVVSVAACAAVLANRNAAMANSFFIFNLLSADPIERRTLVLRRCSAA